MAVTVEDTDSGTAINGGNVTVNSFTALENDYLLVLAGGSAHTLSGSLAMSSSGFTEMFNDAVTVDTRAVYGGGWYKKMGATPDTSVTVNGNGVATGCTNVHLYVLRGVDGTTFQEGSTASDTVGVTDGTPINSPEVTGIVSGALVVSFGVDCHAAGAVSVTGAPSGYANLIATHENDSFECTCGSATKTSTGTSEDPGDFTDDYTTERVISYTFAVKEAGGGASSILPIMMQLAS